MNRYKYTKQKYTDKGKTAYKSTIYPDMGYSSGDIVIQTVDGDRLDLLAYRYYKDTTKWVIIANANNLGKGTLVIPPGLQLIIPSDTELFELKLKENQGM